MYTCKFISAFKFQMGKKSPPNPEQNVKVLNSTLSTISTESTRSGLPPEAEDRFEVELLWCIQQLQSLLVDGTMTDKQVYIANKNLNTLKSDSASFIKKRQIMRNTFGDYRAKMAEDEKKFKKRNSSVKFIPSVVPTKKYLYFKKAHTHDKLPLSENQRNETETPTTSQISVKKLFTSDVSNEPFKFNFTSQEN